MSENFENNETSWIRKKILIFLVCIIISTIFWFLVVLSKDYNDAIRIPVTYVNVPQGKVVVNELPAFVSVEMRSFGFNLLKFRLIKHEDQITIDVAQQMRLKSANQGYVATNSRLDRFASQLNNNIQLIRILPDTIVFNLDDKRMKVVPVIPDVELSFSDQHELSGNITVSPSQIKLTGPSLIMDTIRSVSTEVIRLNKLEKTVKENVRLNIGEDLHGVVSEPAEVDVLIPVDKFTEGKVNVPVTVINVPAGFDVKTYPENITLVYLVALGNYEKVKPEQFRVTADLKSATGGSTRIKVSLANTSPFVRNIRLQPEKVEFILVRK